MNAAEAKNLAMKFGPETIEKIIKDIETKIQHAATEGNFTTCTFFENLPSIFTITNKLVCHFRELGYEVNVINDDFDTVRLDFSWLNA